MNLRGASVVQASGTLRASAHNRSPRSRVIRFDRGTRRVITKRTAHLVAAAAFAWVAVAGVPAQAAPSEVRIDRVHQTKECPYGFCDADDPRLSEGDVVQGRIQVNISASGSAAWFELHALPPGGDPARASDWVCVARRNSGSSPTWMNWTTTTYPDVSGCAAADASPNDITPNGTFRLRAVGGDSAGDTTNSSSFAIALGNKPAPPEWVGIPQVYGNGTENPRVRLQWYGQPDEDVAEYLVIREGPGGETQFHVNAAKPGGQGCDGSAATTYTCIDDAFPQDGYEGSYSYVVYAYRKTQATEGPAIYPCEFSTGNCIESQGSGSDEVELRNPPRPTPTPDEVTPTPTKTRRDRERDRDRGSNVMGSRTSGSNFCFTCGTYEEVLPLQGRGLLPGGLTGEGRYYGGTTTNGQPIARGYVPIPRSTKGFQALSGGMLMLLVAAHMARALRHSKAL